MPRSVAVGRADDPYKRYWWAILAGFGLTGMWLCLPMMETSVGSARVDTGKLAADAAEQSLDAAAGPGGAPGDALDLSMDGARRREKSDGAVASMLYQAPEDPQAASAGLAPPGGSASGSSTLAQSLKAVGDKKDASWGGEKAQRGFSSPGLAGSLSGLGRSSGGSSASAGSGMGAFGSRDAQVGYSSARGLRDEPDAGRAKSGGIAALKQSAQISANAASQSSGDAASSGLSRAFDGSKAQNAIGAGGKGGADAGLYSSLDAAPVNLKANDPKLDKKEFKAPPTAEAADTSDDDSQLMNQLAMAAATAAIGGLIPGVGGQVAMAMMGVMMKNAEAKNQQSVDEHKSKNG
ncbi:MAG: hypothetical protein A2V88_04615 [Elusimicrobia bacterium RBG_16_66_12]|nr:MAG: hypothetical protein A2V88_04615 [Elusimicrobia bacterium RBG_16_66_12]